MFFLSGLGAFLSVLVLVIIIAMSYRTVVSTNDVHIVQSSKKTISYGRGEAAGNTYYRWPSWVPILGVKTTILPMSVFDVDLDGYSAYDQGRLPFLVDVMAFFRIADSNLAAQRVYTFEDLKEQLSGVLQGACRTILARSEIEHILEGRATFGELFTKEVDENLKSWGVTSVKQIELMDIRDAVGSKVIHSIMAKRQSLIDMESRTEVAKNSRAAQTAEIEAQREVELRKQEAQQTVGQRAAEVEKQVGISKEQAQQEVKSQQAETATREMNVQRVKQVRTAEISREVAVVAADQAKKVLITQSEGEKQKAIISAEGDLEAAKMDAEAVRVEGEAKGAAETAILMAPITTQITLAKEIGSNTGYQEYLVKIRVVEKEERVGVEQAKALVEADVKIISNAGDVSNGIKNVMDLFTSKGGTQLGAMLEAIKQTPIGAAIADKLAG